MLNGKLLEKLGGIGDDIYSQLPLNLAKGKVEVQLKSLREAESALTRLAVALFSSEVSLVVGSVERDELLELAVRILPALDLPFKHLTKKLPYNWGAVEGVLEWELQWIEMWLKVKDGDLIDFDEMIAIPLDCYYYHHWHVGCRACCSHRYKPYSGRKASDYVPESKSDLFSALICANACIQAYNFANSCGPFSKIIGSDPYECFCGEMIDANDLRERGDYIEDLKLATRKWIAEAVVCERCKIPGCVGFSLCTSSPVVRARIALVEGPIYGEVYEQVLKAAPDHQDAIDKLHLYFINQRILDLVVGFGFAMSKILGPEVYKLLLRAIESPKKAQELSFLLKKSGLVASAAGAALYGLEGLAVLLKATEARSDESTTQINFKFPTEKFSASIKQLIDTELVPFDPVVGLEYESIQSHWRNRSIILNFEATSNWQRLQSLRPCLSIEFTAIESFPQKYRELVVKELSSKIFGDSKHNLAANCDQLEALIDTIVLAAFVAGSVSEDDTFLLYKNSLCVCTTSPEVIVKNLQLIGLEFMERYSDTIVFFDEYAFSEKSARATSILPAFERLFTIPDRLNSFTETSLIVKEYAQAAWSLVNRTANKNAAVPFAAQMQKLTGLDGEICRKILKGEVSVAFGPVRRSKEGSVDVLLFPLKTIKVSTDFEVEREALLYLKTRLEDSQYKIVSVKVDDHVRVEAAGYLDSFKTLSTLKAQLNREQLAQILRIVGCPQEEDEFIAAWGKAGVPRVVNGAWPYESASKHAGFEVSYQIFF